MTQKENAPACPSAKHWLIDNLREPSTWAGIGLFLTQIAPYAAPQAAIPIKVGIALAAALAYRLREGRSVQQPPSE